MRLYAFGFFLIPLFHLSKSMLFYAKSTWLLYMTIFAIIIIDGSFSIIIENIDL
jgi:hypothetical protein